MTTTMETQVNADDVAEAFYDADYTARLEQEFSTLRLRIAHHFEPFVEATDHVLDFGCGPGFLLELLPGKVKCGVEISEESRRLARDKGLDVRPTLDAFSGAKFDKVISSHALEHVVDPAHKLSQMRDLLDDDGRLILLLPMNEWVHRLQRRWDPNDANKHLYTWTPLLIGNLLTVCGLQPIEIKTIHHHLGPVAAKLGRAMGDTDSIYHALSYLASRLKPSRQLLVVAGRG